MSTEQADRAVQALERIAMALGALCADQMKDIDQPAKAKRLSHLGFSNLQIAGALGTTANSINVSLHRARHRAKGGRKKQKRATR